MRTGTHHALLTPPTSSFKANLPSGAGTFVGLAPIARRMRGALSAELGRSSKPPVVGCMGALENDRGRCKLAVTAHHSVGYAPSVSGRFGGWCRRKERGREERAVLETPIGGRVSPSVCSVALASNSVPNTEIS